MTIGIEQAHFRCTFKVTEDVFDASPVAACWRGAVSAKQFTANEMFGLVH